MEDWDKLRQRIETETEEYFDDKDIDIGEVISVLQKVLMARVDDEYQLDGVAVNLSKAMYDILDRDITENEKVRCFSVLYKVEPFLKKMLYFINEPALKKVQEKQLGLGAVIDMLKLKPQDKLNDDGETIEFEYSEYGYHEKRVYELRNLESHSMKLWSIRKLAANIESLFIFYVEAVNRHKDELIEALASQQNDFSGYIASVISEFEENSKRFISTESVEDYSVFESYAIEHKNISQTDEEEQERSGTVDYIRKNKLPEKRMLLWGDAGMGKSTTLQYLAYIDAKDYSDGQSNIIPVYVPLGMMINQDETLEQYICKKIGVEYLTGVDLFKTGKLSLFLDGVNEISADNSTGVQTRRLKEIQSLLDDYPQMLIIVSNRPDSYSYFKGIPVFRLQKMDLKTITAFIQKNSDSEQVRDIILQGVQHNHRLLQIIGTPLMATRLIEIVQDLREFPQSEGIIIQKFLECLYKREQFEKKDPRFDRLKIHNLLMHLAIYGFRKNGTNSGLSYYEVLGCFADCMEKLHFSYDSTYALEILINLGVLSSDKNREVIVFSHQNYQDYYLSSARQRDEQYSVVFSDTQGYSGKEVGAVDNPHSVLATDVKKPSESSIETADRSGTEKDDSVSVLSMEDYYRLNAHDEKHEKSIIYRLHIADRETRNRDIKLLANYNLLLAAKVVSSGEEDLEIEDYIVEKAIDNIRKNPLKEDLLESILVFLELNRTEELRNHITALINNGNEGLKTLSGIAAELNGEQCVVFLDALSQQDNSNNLLTVLSNILNIFSLKDYEYTWSADRLKTIEQIAYRLNVLLKSSPYNLLKFYMTFNVPKMFFVSNLQQLLEKLVVRHYEIVQDLIQRYNIDFDMSPNKMLYYYLDSGAQNARKKAFITLMHMESKDKYVAVARYFGRVKPIRSAVYQQLSIQDQYRVTRQYNVYYPENIMSKWGSIQFLDINEAHHIMFDMGLLEHLQQDKVERDKNVTGKWVFTEYLKLKKPGCAGKEDAEILQGSTLEDFVQFTTYVGEQMRKKKQQKQEQKRQRKDKRRKERAMESGN